MEKNNKELKQDYLRFQILNQQVAQLQQQINAIENNLAELKFLENSLEEIKNVRKGDKILIPLGNNIFIKGKLEENKEVIMGVGQEVLVKKDINHAKSVIKDQVLELENINLQLEHEIKNAVIELEKIQRGLKEKK